MLSLHPAQEPTMAITYRGEPVTILRPASLEDPSYKEGGGEQVLIRLSNSDETVVPLCDLGNSEAEDTPLPMLPKVIHKVVAGKKKPNPSHRKRA